MHFRKLGLLSALIIAVTALILVLGFYSNSDRLKQDIGNLIETQQAEDNLVEIEPSENQSIRLNEELTSIDKIEPFKSGLQAFENSRKYQTQLISEALIDDSEFFKFLKSGHIEDVVTLAISNLSNPKSHFYLEMVSLECTSHKINRWNNKSLDKLRSNNNLSYSTAELDFLDGVKNAHESFMSSLNTQCTVIEDLLLLNSSQIENSHLELFGVKTNTELLGQVKSLEEVNNLLTEKIGIKLEPGYLKANKLFMDLTNKENDTSTLIKAAIELVEVSTNDPSIFLSAAKCPPEQCKNALGEKGYLDYVTSGAAFGKEGTLLALQQELRKKNEHSQLLAWNLYSKNLIEDGCVYGPDMLKSLLDNKKANRDLLKKLSADETEKARERYVELKGRYFPNAKKILGC